MKAISKVSQSGKAVSVASGTEAGSTDQGDDPSYVVGYKKPPKHTQFKKGHSGNTKGRPKGSSKGKASKRLKYGLTPERLKDTFMEEAYRMISIKDSGKDAQVPIAQAVIRSLGVKAAKGHIGAQKLFAQTLFEIEAANRAASEDYMMSIIQYKDRWTEILAYRAKHGSEEPDPVPHPDNIILDMHRGTVSIKGPLCEEDKAKQDYYRRMLKDWEADQVKYENALLDPLNDNSRAHFVFMLEQCHKAIPMLQTIVGDEIPQTSYEIAKELGVIEYE